MNSVKWWARSGAALMCVWTLLLVWISLCPATSDASPRSACLRNCHLCQQMYGAHFEGHLCAQTCVKLRGQLMPDCTNLVSIAPFLDPQGDGQHAANHV